MEEAHPPRLRRCRPPPSQTERAKRTRRKASPSLEKRETRDGGMPRRSDVRTPPSARSLVDGVAPPNPSSRRPQAKARAPRARGMFDLQDPLLPRAPQPKGEAPAGAIPLPRGDKARRSTTRPRPPWCLRCYAPSRPPRESEKHEGTSRTAAGAPGRRWRKGA